MPDGEINYITKNCDTSDEITQMEQHNGMRSFVVTVNDNGKIEVNPKNQEEFCQQSNCNHKAKKRLGKGKQRIRIALIEEDATGSSDVEQDENGSIVSIDAQSFDAMHDRFVKIYNKNVRGKPSFVVLEDALMRKRIEDTLQNHFDSTTCHHHQQQHCHAQQQTSPCDIGAHTGSQTDEFLLQCAMRSRLPGHSRGCQATDHTYNKVELSHNASSSSSRKHLQVPSLRRLNQLRSLPFNNSTLSSATLAAPVVSAPHVTITVSPPSTANMPVIMQAQQQPLQQQQIQQQQQLLLPAATHSYCNCFSNLQPCISNSCNNCCLPQPVKSNYCLPATNTCFLQPQQQQHQQQYPAMTTTYGNCTSNCCLLGPTLAQTTLGYGPTMSEQCSHNILETLSPQQCQDCPAANWPTQICNHCQYYPMSNCNMADFGRVHYASCPMQQQAPQQQPQQQQALQQGPQQQQAPQQQQVPQQQRAQQQQPAPQQQPVPHQQLLQQQRLQQQPDQLLQIQTQHQQSQQQQRKKQLENKSASQNPSEQLSKKLVEETLAASAAKLDKIAKKVRYKLSGTAASNKLYMARFGRTCLILKPNMCSMPPRLLTKPISRCTSVSAFPQKNIEK